MKQHASAKAEHPDCVVFFRLGDFYEMFGEDAILVSRELDLTLTSRNKGKPDEIPMAGVPHHAAHGYIGKLLARGFKVAICEQMADPATVKGIVPRQVVRVLTPGTWNDGSEWDETRNNWLCALEAVEGKLGIALLDLGTAELLAASVADLSSALSEVGRAAPAEVLISQAVIELGHTQADLRSAFAQVAPGAQIRLQGELSAGAWKHAVADITFSTTEPSAVAAAGRALSFAKECYCDREFMVWRVGHLNPSGILHLDRAAQTHLELVSSTVGTKDATLFATLNRTRSPGGARLLRRRLLAPLCEVAQIRRRQDQVETLVNNPEVRTRICQELKEVGDLERLAVRGAEGGATPRDLGLVRRGLRAAQQILHELRGLPDAESRRALGLEQAPDLVEDLRETLERALSERPPTQAKEGAIFVAGYDSELDSLALVRSSGSAKLSELEERLKGETQIPNLRVKYTRVFGWYVEVSKSNSSKVPASFRRKQTVAGGERYTLPELDDLAEEIELAEERLRSRELALLEELVAQLARASQRVHRLTAFLSNLDVGCALAEVATEFDYCRPCVDESDHLEIVDGRHPVVERLAAAGRFVPNDTQLTLHKEHLWLISGPNMAGKSTFLRQVALIVIMAQMGAYVPAKRARIGVVDRVLSRVGASDNLAGGESTFMVEMRETASILACATSRSLIILDEVGRGTSTFDGLAIAWAVAEYLDQVISARTLFATHYHELTALGEQSPTCANYCVSAREHDGDVVFLHRVLRGAASRSYGVAVAQLAGLPESVLSRAKALLESLEGGDREVLLQGGPVATLGARQLDLFAPPHQGNEAQVLEKLRCLDPDRLTGLEALSLLHQLRAQLISDTSTAHA